MNVLFCEAYNPNSIGLYLVYAAIILVVIIESLWYFVKAYRRAIALNMDKAKLKKVISSSVIFSILPSVGIFIGVITIAGTLGVPLPATRLSVIGALQYELQAADWAAIQMGYTEGLASITTMDARTLITFALAMSFGIIWGPLFCIFFFKKAQPKMLKSTKSDQRWADALFGAVFIGMTLAYLAVAIVSVVFPLESGGLSIASFYSIIGFVSSALVMWLCDYLIQRKKQAWLENFSLAFSMLVGMALITVLNVTVG